MKVTVNHKLTSAEAKDRISKLVFALKKQYKDKITNISESWNGYKNDFSFRMQGMKIVGNILVTENNVTVNGKLPFMAMPFKSMIESTIKEKASELLQQYEQQGTPKNSKIKAFKILKV